MIEWIKSSTPFAWRAVSATGKTVGMVYLKKPGMSGEHYAAYCPPQTWLDNAHTLAEATGLVEAKYRGRSNEVL